MVYSAEDVYCVGAVNLGTALYCTWSTVLLKVHVLYFDFSLQR